MNNPYQDPRLQHAASRAMADAMQNRQQNVMAGPQTFIGHIDFPELEHYGYDHHEQTSELAKRVFASLPMFTAGTTQEQQFNLEVVRLSALMHDLGRKTPWTKHDPEHGVLSASIAEDLLKKDPKFTSDPSMRDRLIKEVPRIIAAHDLGGEQPRDPRAQALWDADSYEIYRFEVGNIKHMKGPVRERMSRLCTEWARVADNQRKWRVFRGW